MMSDDFEPYRLPEIDDIVEHAESCNLQLSNREAEDYTALVSTAVEGSRPIRGTDPIARELQPASLSDRGEAYRPGRDEDPLNAWVTKMMVEPTSEGPLSGVTIGLKDSIALAGCEMTAGSTILEGFVPEIDAPLVTRLLENGATIVGKLNMESFAWSGRGDLSDFGTVRNPHDVTYLPGGSSSGSGAAPANGECDIAIGTDQAGSIRIPSSWCGLVGIKPTHGLVPYTGILPLEHTLDHVGPMGTSVELVAKSLEVMAGEATVESVRLDDRQPHGVRSEAYCDAVKDPVDQYSIAVLEEGFDWPMSDPVVDEIVRGAIDQFESEVDAIDQTSVPLHRDSVTIWGPIAMAGGIQNLTQSGVGLNNRSWSWPALAKVLDSKMEVSIDGLPPSVKRTMLAAEYMRSRYGNLPYAQARDAAIHARRAYDRILNEYDALVLPTMVTLPFKIGVDESIESMLDREVLTILNTCLFNVTGHPAITVPCGSHEGLPVGAMFVGAHFDESTLISVASHFMAVVD